MQKNNAAATLSALEYIVVFAAVVTAFFTVRGNHQIANTVFDVLVAIGILLIGAVCFRFRHIAKAFDFEKQSRMKWVSYLLSAGLFADFVEQCIRLYQVGENGAYVTAASYLPKVLIGVFALGSGFYFSMVALSFSERKYDFRNLKLFHLVTVLWAVARILELVFRSDIIGSSPHTALRYSVALFATGFFYSFSYEADREACAKRYTLFFSKITAMTTFLYVWETLLLLLNGQIKINDSNTVFALTALTLCLFSLSFERNLVLRSNTETK